MKSIRINTTINDNIKYIPIDLSQKFDELNILSVSLTQEDVYRSFCSDYGVIIGRVIGNDGIGIPNAKISIFIPQSEDDAQHPLKSIIYPYKNPHETNLDGVRYNLLPELCDVIRRVSESETCVDSNRFLVANGTFPSKRRVLNDEIVLDIFKDYYSFTTKTNESGDYMLFGVPVGQQRIHMDIDLSDIGDLSMTPYDFIELGYNESQFVKTSSGGLAFRRDSNLDILPQIITHNYEINVQPFWGDVDACQAGITRHDFDITNDIKIQRTIVFFGENHANNEDSWWKNGGRRKNEPDTVKNMANFDYIIEAYKQNELFEPIIFKYYEIVDISGIFCINLPMYQDFYITDEFGNRVKSNDGKGVATTGFYKFKFRLSETNFLHRKQRFPSVGTHYVPMPRPTLAQWASENNINLDFSPFNKKIKGGDGKAGGIAAAIATAIGLPPIPGLTDGLILDALTDKSWEIYFRNFFFPLPMLIGGKLFPGDWIWFKFDINVAKFYTLMQQYGGVCVGNKHTYSINAEPLQAPPNRTYPFNTSNATQCGGGTSPDSHRFGGDDDSVNQIIDFTDEDFSGNNWLIGSLFHARGELRRRGTYKPYGTNSSFVKFFALNMVTENNINPENNIPFSRAMLPGRLYYGNPIGFGGTDIRSFQDEQLCELISVGVHSSSVDDLAGLSTIDNGNLTVQDDVIYFDGVEFGYIYFGIKQFRTALSEIISKLLLDS